MIDDKLGYEMKEEFNNLLLSVKKEGIKDLLNYLEEATDFYIAPASSNYHGNYKYGLLEHSLLVEKHFRILIKLYNYNLSIDSCIIIGLLHDLCKTNFYTIAIRSRKKRDENNDIILNEKQKAVWEDIEYYEINDKLPLGHGEKSVFIIMRYLTLTNEELMGIRWHMMSYDSVTKDYIGNLTLTNALNKYPIISLIHCADLLSISQKLPTYME